MKHWHSTITLLVALSMAACNPGGGAISGPSSSDQGADGATGAEYQVPASTSTPAPTATPRPTVYHVEVGGPVETSIKVQAGDFVWVTATGSIVLGFFAGSSGPDGLQNGRLSDYNVAPDIPHGALMCRIDEGAWLWCGSNRELRAEQAGTLELAINDNDRDNNVGTYSVQVAVSGTSVREPALWPPAGADVTDDPDLSTEWVGREPRLWIPGPSAVLPRSPLPLIGLYSLSNADYANGQPDSLARFEGEGRVVTVDYVWLAPDCATAERLALSEINLKVVLFASVEGAQQALETNRSTDTGSSSVRIAETTVGQSGYLAWETYEDCGQTIEAGYVLFQRNNMMAMFWVNRLSPAADVFQKPDYLERWGRYLDRLIQYEGQQHPGTPEQLQALARNVESQVVEPGGSTETGVTEPGNYTGGNGDWGDSLSDCLLNGMDYAECHEDHYLELTP